MSSRRNQNNHNGQQAGLTPEEIIRKRRQLLAARYDITSFITRLVFMAILLWILFSLIFGLTAMGNDDMVPRISAGDLLLYYRLEDNWRADDIAVFEKDGVQYTGRIIAAGGDSVEITEDARVMINGSIVAESDIYYSTPQYDSDVTYPVTLREDEVFILCDFREGGKDSRSFGPVSMDEIKGKVITVIRRSGL